MKRGPLVMQPKKFEPIKPIDWAELSAAQTGKTYDDALRTITEVIVSKINEIVEDYNARRKN